MASNPGTSAALDQLLKRLYPDWDIEQLVNLTYPVLADCAREGSASLGGSGFFFPVRTRSSEGHAYIGESSDLPTARLSTVRQAVVSPTVHAGVIELTGLAVDVSTSNAASFARAFDENTEQTIQAMSAYKEGAFFRDGSGQIGVFNGNPAATVGPHVLDDVAHLRIGMRVDITQSDNTLRHVANEVVDVDWVNRTVTFGTALDANVDDNGIIYITGSQDVSGGVGVAITPAVREPLGLKASLLATGTYLGISRTDHPYWKASSMAVSGFLDEDVLLRARTRVTQVSGIPFQAMAGRFALVTHPQQVDVLFKLAIPRLRYTSADGIDLGNADNVKFGNIPIKTSYNAPVDEAYLGDWQYSQTLYTPNGKLHIDTEYNGSALKWVATKDVGLVFCKAYEQFVVKRPNAFIRLTALSTPSR